MEKDKKNGVQHPGFKVPEPVIDEVEGFFAGGNDLFDTYFDWNAQDKKWESRSNVALDRNDTNETSDEIHIESKETIDVDSPPDSVRQICDENDATKLFQAILGAPADNDVAQALHNAISAPISEARKAANIEMDLALSIGQLRMSLMTYAIFGWYISQLPDPGQKRDLHVEQEAFEVGFFIVVDGRGYPSEWKELFVKAGDYYAKSETLPFTSEHVNQALLDDRGRSNLNFEQEKGEIWRKFHILDAQSNMPADPSLHGLNAEPQTNPQGPQSTVAGSAQPHVISTPQKGVPALLRSEFDDCVKLESRPGYINDGGEWRKVEVWKKTGGGHSLLVRMNPEGQNPGICDIVALGLFGKGTLETCKSMKCLDASTLKNIDDLKYRPLHTFNAKFLA